MWLVTENCSITIKIHNNKAILKTMCTSVTVSQMVNFIVIKTKPKTLKYGTHVSSAHGCVT